MLDETIKTTNEIKFMKQILFFLEDFQKDKNYSQKLINCLQASITTNIWGNVYIYCLAFICFAIILCFFASLIVRKLQKRAGEEKACTIDIITEN